MERAALLTQRPLEAAGGRWRPVGRGRSHGSSAPSITIIAHFFVNRDCGMCSDGFLSECSVPSLLIISSPNDGPCLSFEKGLHIYLCPDTPRHAVRSVFPPRASLCGPPPSRRHPSPSLHQGRVPDNEAARPE